MASVAEMLRTAREKRRTTIQQVAEATRLKVDHIRALEEGNYAAFPAAIYLKGSLRTYAAYLKLNVSELFQALESEAGATGQLQEPPALMPPTPTAVDKVMLWFSTINWKIAGPLVGIAVIGGIAVATARLWERHYANNPLGGVKPAVYQAPRNSGETLAVPAPAPQTPAQPQPQQRQQQQPGNRPSRTDAAPAGRR